MSVILYDDQVTLSEYAKLHIRVIKFSGGTLLVWVGDDRAALSNRGLLDNLSLALGSTSTTVINDGSDVITSSLTQSLSSKYNGNRPVYLSLNISSDGPRSDDTTLLLMRKHVMSIVKTVTTDDGGKEA